jgi:hypothetical protein
VHRFAHTVFERHNTCTVGITANLVDIIFNLIDHRRRIPFAIITLADGIAADIDHTAQRGKIAQHRTPAVKVVSRGNGIFQLSQSRQTAAGFKFTGFLQFSTQRKNINAAGIGAV